MKNILLLSMILLMACHSASKMTVLPSNNALTQEVFSPKDNGYRLIWEDNFEGTELDTTKWNIRGIGPRRIGYNSASAVSVNNGCLNLMFDIVKDSIIAGAIGTSKHFETQYGYFECRAQLQKSVGPWAAFWMQSPFISNGEDPAKFGAEIDIFEYFKEIGNDTLTHSVHWAYGPHIASVGRLKSTIKGLSEGFHTFGLEWTPKQYSFFIDGLKFHEKTQGLSHVNEYIILSMEIPATIEKIKYACAPDTFLIDYVKVYKKR